jgi:small-conductance mechanosensitive channel
MTEQQSNHGAGHWAGLSYCLRAFSIALSLIILFLISPATAQTGDRSIAIAPVVIDGTELFQVSSSGDYTAQERADSINVQLQDAVESKTQPDVAIGGNNKLPTILLDGHHLLTVTDRDTVVGRTQDDQAQIWAAQIVQGIERAQRERTPAYLQRAILLSVGAVVIALALHWGLGRFWRRTLGPELRAVTHIPDPDNVTAQPTSLNLLLNFLLWLLRAAIWLGAGLYIFNRFPWTRQWSYQFIDILLNSFVAPLFTLGDRKYSIIDLLILAGLVFGLEIVTKTVTNLVKSRVLRVTISNRGAREAIAIIIRYSLLFVGGLVLFQVWGIDLSSLAILASALGIGIGLGLQDIAKDIGSGLVILFERPIQVGDFVQVGDYEGTIERIGSRSTLIRTLDHVSIIVPNSQFLSGNVINWSHDNPVSRLHLPVGVAYGSDLEAVRLALLDAAQENSRVLSSPRPLVLFKGFGDSSLDLELLVWIAEPSKQFLIKSDLYFSIESQLRQHQVEIPFPQRDLNVRSGRLPLELSPQLEQTLQQWLNQSQNGRKRKDEG